MANQQQSQEDLQKQQQMMMEQQQQYRKYMMLQQMIGVIRSLDKKSVLDTLSKQVGSNLYCPNPMISQQLTQKIITLLNDSPELDDHAVKIQQILLNAISLTNAIRSQLMFSGAGNQMGMGMMPGMMGGMMNGMGMMGMNPFGMQQPQQPAADGTDDATRKIQIAKEYIKNYAFQSDPLIFLSMLSNQLGLSIDFASDSQFEELIVQALSYAVQQLSMTNPMVFQSVYYVIQQLYMTDYYSKLNNGKGGQQTQQFNQFGMMNGVGMMGMNPMMGMGMMPGMTGSMGMPGMNNGSVGAGCIW